MHDVHGNSAVKHFGAFHLSQSLGYSSRSCEFQERDELCQCRTDNSTELHTTDQRNRVLRLLARPSVLRSMWRKRWPEMHSTRQHFACMMPNLVGISQSICRSTRARHIDDIPLNLASNSHSFWKDKGVGGCLIPLLSEVAH